MAPGKQKAQKMSLGNFLADENFGSWADEMEDMPLSCPSTSTFANDRRMPPASSTGFGGPSFNDRGFAMREPLPLPTEPPYTAHIGNLSFDATSADISELFVECSVTNVRVVEDKLTKSPKGFGYVEFETVEGLKKALDLSGVTLQGRAIRVSIAEPPKDRDVKEFDWTRRGPLPDAPQRRVPDRSSFGRNLDNVSDAGSEPRRRGGFESDGKIRDFSNWERKGPLSPPPMREGGRPTSNEGPSFRSRSPAWGEGRSERSQDGSRPPRREFQERAPTAAELDNQWRARMKPDAPKEPSNPPSPAATSAVPVSPVAAAAAPAPATRPKLNLQKRTVPEAAASPTATTESKSSIFGGARPIDTATREKEVEQRRQLAVRQKKEADEKAKAEKAEKQRAAKEAAKSEKPASTLDPNGKDTAETPRGGGNFEILRRAGEDESGMGVEQDQETQAEAGARAEATEAAKADDKTNGSSKAGPNSENAGGDDEGWNTVSSKPRNNRRGGRNFA